MASESILKRMSRGLANWTTAEFWEAARLPGETIDATFDRLSNHRARRVWDNTYKFIGTNPCLEIPLDELMPDYLDGKPTGRTLACIKPTSPSWDTAKDVSIGLEPTQQPYYIKRITPEELERQLQLPRRSARIELVDHNSGLQTPTQEFDNDSRNSQSGHPQ